MTLSMKKYAWQILMVLLFMLMITIGSKGAALADVNVGEKIDTSNWQKVQGVVPDVVLDYVKKGWMTLKIGKLNYEPGDAWFIQEGEKRNKGKYDLTAKGEILDKATGALDPRNFIGVPFPVSEMNPSDPKMGEKFVNNIFWMVMSYGSNRQTACLHFVGNQYERKICGPQKAMKFVSTPYNMENQKYESQFGPDILECFIMRLTEPYELNGLATMSWQYAKQSDRVFAYIPALRRVRTMTAAARSDSMFGTDYSLDDAGCGWWAKPRAFNIKYLRTQETLSQYANPDVIRYTENPDHSLSLQKTPFVTGKFGYETPGWTGKPWAVTNSLWVKRKAYVFEIFSKDPYYNYGRMELWVDAKSVRPIFKIINDRAGKRWKVMIMNNGLGVAPEGYPWGMPLCAMGDVIYDEQRNHATLVMETKPGEIKDWNVKWDMADFSLNGMAKIGK